MSSGVMSNHMGTWIDNNFKDRKRKKVTYIGGKEE